MSQQRTEVFVFIGAFNAAQVLPEISPYLWLETILPTDNSFILVLDLCSHMHSQLLDLVYTGVCLSNQLNLSQEDSK